MPGPLALSGLAVAVPTQMLLRRYTIEIWPLQRMVKLYLPIAGETGGADKLDDSKGAGLEVRGSESVAPLTFCRRGRSHREWQGHGERGRTRAEAGHGE